MLGNYEAVSLPVLSIDGSTYAFGVRSTGQWHINHSGKVTPVDLPVYSVFLSNDGKEHGFVAKEETQYRIVWKGKPGKTYKYIDSPTISRSGSCIAYRAETEYGEVVVVGDREIESASRVSPPSITQDEQYVVFGALGNGEIRRRMVAVRN
jgi:hypothetical protein